MSYQSKIVSKAGVNKGKIMLFTLSTCIWCRKTKALFEELGIEHSFVDVDLLEGKDQEDAYAVIEKYNEGGSFPTIIINDGKKVIVGFDEKAIRNL